MPVSDRHQLPLRVPRHLHGRLQKAAARRNLGINTYVVLAVEKEVEADEARNQDQGMRQQRRKDGDAPPGLGLRARPLPAEIQVPAVEPAAPVVVNVGAPTTAPGGDLIAGLAAYVRSGQVFERDRRLRQAMDILRAQSRISGEREGLERQLAQALAEKPQTGQLTGTRTSLGAIGSLFR